jgi:mRNA interferase MazF
MSLKEFDAWNEIKKSTHAKEIIDSLYFHEREIWWCSLGVNIGVETDGKHENFERPMLVIKKFNGQMFWAIPLTTQEKIGKYYFPIKQEDKISFAGITQIRTLSSKRLIRKMGMVSEVDFVSLIAAVKNFLP